MIISCALNLSVFDSLVSIQITVIPISDNLQS